MADKTIEKMTKKELVEQFWQIQQELEPWRDKANSLLAEIRQLRDSAGGMSGEVEASRDNANSMSAEMQSHLGNFENLLAKAKEQGDNAGDLVADAEEAIEKTKSDMESIKGAIESLLPGAAAPALASTFHQAQDQSARVKWLWGGFIGSLVGLFSMSVGFVLLLDGSELSWEYVLVRLPVGIPFIWVAWYCQRSLSQIDRIMEEYNHKERVMTVYTGFSRELERLSDSGASNPQTLGLIEMVIKTINRNPARVVHPSATMLDSFLRRKESSDVEQEKPD